METLTHRLARARTRSILAAVMLFVVGQGAAYTADTQTQGQEQRIEAAFLYNFAKFIEWPAGFNSSDSDPFTFCVFGSGPFQQTLGESLAGKSINGRALLVRQISRPEDATHCQVAFLGGGEQKHLLAVFEALTGTTVLTVADFESFASRGGMIQLIKEGNKFRFAINVDAVNRHGLRVSSKLLQLAEVVHEGPGERGKP